MNERCSLLTLGLPAIKVEEEEGSDGAALAMVEAMRPKGEPRLLSRDCGNNALVETRMSLEISGGQATQPGVKVGELLAVELARADLRNLRKEEAKGASGADQGRWMPAQTQEW